MSIGKHFIPSQGKTRNEKHLTYVHLNVKFSFPKAPLKIFFFIYKAQILKKKENWRFIKTLYLGDYYIIKNRDKGISHICIFWKADSNWVTFGISGNCTSLILLMNEVLKLVIVSCATYLCWIAWSFERWCWPWYVYTFTILKHNNIALELIWQLHQREKSWIV